MADQVGAYSLATGGRQVSFWPLVPGTSVSAAIGWRAPMLPPNHPSMLVVLPQIGLFDVLIVPSADAMATTTVAAPVLLTTVTAQPTQRTMPLIANANRAIRISFAVPIPPGASFDGKLQLTIRRQASAPAPIRVDLPIQVTTHQLVSDLVVFFVVHGNVQRRYGWVKQQVVDRASPGSGLASADARLSVLRENQTFRSIHRYIDLRSDAGGFLAHAGRNVLGLPGGWPLLYRASQRGYVQRGHLFRLTNADIRHNLTPLIAAPPIRMIRTSDAQLGGRRILLDPGHGVVYDHKARRSQEWYVAHRIADRIVEMLVQQHGMARADILFTRTAGFGLIRPQQISAPGAIKDGDDRFGFDLANRRIHITSASVTLRDLSDLLLTRHTATNQAEPVDDARRQRLLDQNATVVTAIVARLNQQLAPRHLRVRPGSVRWDIPSARYAYTRESITNPATPGTDAELPIQTGDWFSVDDEMMDTLADRSACWSIQSEIGAGTPAAGARPAFVDAARQAMIDAGAREYMKRKILYYAERTRPPAYLANGIKGWKPERRVDYMNANDCSLYVSLHENGNPEDSTSAVGSMVLVSGDSGPDAPPDDQIRVGKIFMKYIDASGNGLRQGGVAPGKGFLMLKSSNQVRGRYAYFEFEFMDSVDPANPARYRYQDMVGDEFIDRVATQVVAGIVEALLDRQANLDQITFHGNFTLW